MQIGDKNSTAKYQPGLKIKESTDFPSEGQFLKWHLPAILFTKLGHWSKIIKLFVCGSKIRLHFCKWKNKRILWSIWGFTWKLLRSLTWLDMGLEWTLSLQILSLQRLLFPQQRLVRGTLNNGWLDPDPFFSKTKWALGKEWAAQHLWPWWHIWEAYQRHQHTQ